MSCVLAFVLAMPALTKLSLVVGEKVSDVPSKALVRLIPAADVAKWHGRGSWPADARGEKVTEAHLLRAISSLPCLTDLTITVDGKVLIPATFPRSLCRLTVGAFYGSSDISELFGAGPHDQIRELVIGNGDVDVQVAIRACPEITALTVGGYHDFSQEDLDSILSTCKNLQRLCIDRDSLFSFARLESSPCAQSLTSIKSRANLAPGSMEVICRCCPAIEELAVRGVGPADVRAMASLMRLCVLEVYSHSHDQGQGPELSEAFTALGNAEGATPFTRLMLRHAKFDATGFFSSHRCSALRALELDGCTRLTKQVMHALAINARDTLESLVFSWVRVVPIVPLLAECRRLERLVLHCCNTEDMQTIGQTCKAPLRFVEILSRRIFGGAVCAFMPALAGVVFLRIGCSAEAILQYIIPQCPCLQVLCVRSPSTAKKLRAEIPKHITIWP
jgi:hypothetical protein